jgi:hypothetical protein
LAVIDVGVAFAIVVVVAIAIAVAVVVDEADVVIPLVVVVVVVIDAVATGSVGGRRNAWVARWNSGPSDGRTRTHAVAAAVRSGTKGRSNENESSLSAADSLVRIGSASDDDGDAVFASSS